MKMTQCKKCGTAYPSKSKRCPNCSAKASNSAIKTISIVLLICLVIMVVAAMCGDNSEPTSESSSQPTSAPQQNESSSEEKVIYTDDDLKVSFIKVEDGADLGVTACYIYLKVENIGSQTVNVSLTDAYANDTAVTVMSGLPMKLAPGKNSRQPFLFGYNDIFTSADEVEKLEFKITLLSEDFSSIVKTTESIAVDVK